MYILIFKMNQNTYFLLQKYFTTKFHFFCFTVAYNNKIACVSLILIKLNEKTLCIHKWAKIGSPKTPKKLNLCTISPITIFLHPNWGPFTYRCNDTCPYCESKFNRQPNKMPSIILSFAFLTIYDIFNKIAR